MTERGHTPSAKDGLVVKTGDVVRCVPTPSTTTFLLNLEDNHYYDRQPCCGRFMRREYP